MALKLNKDNFENPATASVHDRIISVAKPDAEPIGKGLDQHRDIFKKKELKGKQLNVRIQMSLYEDIEKISKATGNTVGTVVTEILREFVESDTAKEILKNYTEKE
jgi:predicted DNA-binding protein